jgi:small-conductance mechanosensitive channel
MMTKALDRVVDAIDIETFLYCKSEDEAKELAESLANELHLPHGDIVFLEFKAWGARVRIRSYIHHPGDHYRWMETQEEK